MTDSLRRCLHSEAERKRCKGKLQVKVYDDSLLKVLCGEKSCLIGETGPAEDWAQADDDDVDALELD